MKRFTDKQTIEKQNYITITGETSTGEAVYVSFRKMKNEKLAQYLNKNYNKKYNKNDSFINYDTTIQESDGNSYRMPKNKKQRKNWLDAMGWEDIPGRFAITRLDLWTLENIQAFIKKLNLKKIVVD
jgi:hypothetical protein